MSAGGATWETAGLLEEGAAGTNSFTVSSGTAPWKRGWWKFTATERKQVTINLGFSTFVGSFKQLAVTVYSGDEDPDSAVFVTHGPSGFRQFYTVPGTTYRVMARAAKLSEVDLVSAYRPVLTVADPLPAATPWISTLRDQENKLIITEGDLITENPPAYDTPGVHLWFNDLIKTIGPPGRLGDFLIQEVAFGTDIDADPSAAALCAWSHAAFGDDDNQLWNTSGTDSADTGPPVCFPLVDGFADPALNNPPSYSLQYHPQIGGTTASVDAEAGMQARGLWLQHARDHLLEAGVLSASLDPEADGVPAEFAGDAEIEYEGPLELIKVEVTGDIIGRPSEGTEPNGVTFFLNDFISPGYTPGSGWASSWRKGAPGTWNDDPAHPHRMFDYDDGDPVWTELDEFTGWDDLNDYTGDEPPDTLVGICMSIVVTGMPDIDTSAGNFSDIAVRLTFRSPRYRWLYNGPTTVVRQWPRDDARGVSSAPRLWPPTKSNRLAGGYPGGSGL